MHKSPLSSITGFSALFRISQNLPQRSNATRAATWSPKIRAVCGDPQTSRKGAVLRWNGAVPAQHLSPSPRLLEHSTRGYREVKAPLSLFLPDGPRFGGLLLLLLPYALPPREAADRTLTDRRSAVSPIP